MGILIVWGMVVFGAGALLVAWLLGLPVPLRDGQRIDPGLVALGLIAVAVLADSVIRLRARRRR